jgi:peptidoglycan hydrolase CwlO-like protein
MLLLSEIQKVENEIQNFILWNSDCEIQKVENEISEWNSEIQKVENEIQDNKNRIERSLIEGGMLR